MINTCYTLQKQPHRTITNKTRGKQISLLSFIVKRVKTRKTKTTATMLDPYESQNVRQGNLA